MPQLSEISLFITGIDGFAGRHLRDLALALGITVSGTSRSNNRPEIGVFQCDITNEEKLSRILNDRKPSHIAHLAAYTSYLGPDVPLVYQTNILGSRALLSAASRLKTAPKRVLLISSGNIYKPSHAHPLNEETPLEPRSDYSVSKVAMEALSPFWEQYFPITIARPFNHIGRGQSITFLIPKLVNYFKSRSDVIPIGNISSIRDFSDVRDTVKSYLSLLTMETPPSPVNVCTGVGHSISAVIQMLSIITAHVPKLEIDQSLKRANEIDCLIGNPHKLRESGSHCPKPSLQECLEWILSDNL